MSRVKRWTWCAILAPLLLLVVGFAAMAVLNEVANPATLTVAELLVFAVPYVAMMLIDTLTIWALWWPLARTRSVVAGV